MPGKEPGKKKNEMPDKKSQNLLNEINEIRARRDAKKGNPEPPTFFRAEPQNNISANITLDPRNEHNVVEISGTLSNSTQSFALETVFNDAVLTLAIVIRENSGCGLAVMRPSQKKAIPFTLPADCKRIVVECNGAVIAAEELLPAQSVCRR